MYETEIRIVRTRAASAPIVLLEGPRGTGMADIARHAFPSLNYIDLENPGVLALASRSVRTFLLAFPQGAVINGAPLVPGLLEAVRYYVDKSGTGVRFVLVSTCIIDTDDMGGRLVKFRFAGLSAPIIEAAKLPSYNPFRMIFDGQLEEFLYEHRSCSEILDSCLEKDILRHINRSNLGLFRSFMAALARRSGNRLSLNAAAVETGISAPTAKTWLSVACRYGLARIVSDTDGKESLAFLCDTGVMCLLLGITKWEDLVLSPLRDEIVRTYAFNELLRGRNMIGAGAGIYMSRISDFLADWKRRYCIIVEPNLDVTPEKAALAKKASGAGRKAVVLYLGDVTYSMGNLDCISFRDWAKISAEVDYFS